MKTHTRDLVIACLLGSVLFFLALADIADSSAVASAAPCYQRDALTCGAAEPTKERGRQAGVPELTWSYSTAITVATLAASVWFIWLGLKRTPWTIPPPNPPDGNGSNNRK